MGLLKECTHRVNCFVSGCDYPARRYPLRGIETESDDPLYVNGDAVQLIRLVAPLEHRLDRGSGEFRQSQNRGRASYRSVFGNSYPQNDIPAGTLSTHLRRVNRFDPVHQLAAGYLWRH